MDELDRAAFDSLLGQLDDLLEVAPDDPSAARLRPTAYPDDPDREAEYQLLAGEELRTARRAAIASARASLGHDALTEDDLWAWLRALNALRLVLAERLHITADGAMVGPEELDPEDPDAVLWAIHDLCEWAQHHIVVALGG